MHEAGTPAVRQAATIFCGSSTGAARSRGRRACRARMQDADGVHHGVGALEQARKQGDVMHVALHHLDVGQQQNMASAAAAAGGNGTLTPSLQRRLAMALPIKPEPPTMTTRFGFMFRLDRAVAVDGMGWRTRKLTRWQPGRDRAESCLERLRPFFEHRRVDHRVGEHLLDVVAGLVERIVSV